jgi:hypothetical protein
MLVPMRRWRAFMSAVGALTILAGVLPGMAAAHDIADPNLSADQARAVFVTAGYQVDEVQTWDWLTPVVTTFQVHDRARDRVLLVEVYPNVAEAQRGSTQAVEGYSVSTWIDNLAVFEANAEDYQSAMTAALARSLGMTQADTSVALAPLARVDEEYTDLVYEALAVASSDTARD